MEPGDPRFVRRRAAFLRWIGDRISGDPAATSSTADKVNRRHTEFAAGVSHSKTRIHPAKKLAGLR
jgi:hypothetical protein